ncbi:small RNA 2'-O-methyltransferase isoform X3 [Clinocottus analis]|uniref:small RNA 2'-O-methyltransferase isoform X3 n=1 Tax=Clinocottus analis TaxID=304258 RepID=UPI0035BF4E71
MDPIFSPPLHRQRHQFVIDFVKRNKPQKVLDLGCSECTLLKQLRFHREMQLLVGLDIDGATLKKKMHGLAPMSTDYLQPSDDQLRIELYQGSVTQRDARLRGFDLVTSIELALKVCLDYGYEVEFTGVGDPPAGQEERVGFCSQIGVFRRLRGRAVCNMLFCDEDEFSYTLLYSKNYPSLHDNKILQRVLVTEVLSGAETLRRKWAEETTGDRDAADGRAEACGAAMRILAEHPEVEDGELSWTDGRGQQESCELRRCVSVPLAVLWSRCPKVRGLGGSLSNLRQLLMDHPDVTLSQDGSAVLLNDQEQEEEEHDELEDSGYAEARVCSLSVEPEENWDANV